MKKRRLILGAALLGVALTSCGFENSTSTIEHSHTYASEWSKDESKHWHQATCGDDLKSDEAAHTFNEGEETTSGTKFTCTVCGYEKTETSKYQVSDSKWNEIIDNTLNYTMLQTVTNGNETTKSNCYFTKDAVLMDHVDSNKDLYAKDSDNNKYYYYSFNYGDNDWLKEEISEDSFKASFGKENSGLPLLKNEFSKFTYNLTDKKYTLAALDVSNEFQEGLTVTLSDISISFENEAIKSLNFNLTMTYQGKSITAVTSYKDFGKTTIEIPGIIHTHTFSEEWSQDDLGHWHESTCQHNLISDYGEHTFNDGVETLEGTKYTCTVCGKEKVEKSR